MSTKIHCDICDGTNRVAQIRKKILFKYSNEVDDFDLCVDCIKRIRKEIEDATKKPIE